MKWRAIDTGCNTASWNMAFDHHLVGLVGRGKAPPTLRFYWFCPQGVTIGYFQRFTDELAWFADSGIQVVRRLTGGKAVLHSGDLTYSFVFLEDNPVLTGTVLEVYKLISQGFVRGLRALGVPAEMVKGKKKGDAKSPLCFQAVSFYEVVIDGKKILGSAQMRRGGVVLQQGSLLLYDPEPPFYSVAGMTTVETATGMRLSRREVMEAIVEGMSSALGIDIVWEECNTKVPAELVEFYSCSEWNKGKQGDFTLDIMASNL